ncbi:MAG TPA: F420-dependent NADP oxidoreductase [Saprospiraceae bacterium]|nr:F420-dependent NADP oxidoreductase [Saprospiraceae bacterium]
MHRDIVLIGSGNLATALGKKLLASGHRILQVYSRDFDHAKILAERLQAQAINQLDQINSHAQVYLICIKDDAIERLSQELSKKLEAHVIIAHSSGVNSPDRIASYFTNRSLFYPLQTFSKFKELDWTHIPIFIEGSDEAKSILRPLAQSLSSQLYEMNDQMRTHLHLASVFANNFSNYNLLAAKKILDIAQVPFEVLHSLMIETVDKAFRLDPINSQTGPAKRGDMQTIEKHIRLLVSEFPEYRSLYKKYSQIIEQTFKHENSGADSTS